MLDKIYDAEEVEARIAKQWEKENAFAAGAKSPKGAKPYCITIPPPNVTGSLHMGHALNNTLQDILIRFERMRGKNVLWQPGMDHAGIATQMVVERQLQERNEPDRTELGREKFIERVWEWKNESGGTIFEQLKRLGASCDWSRERFTMDEGLSNAVLEVFVRLYKEGLIYKDKRLVNWDPVFQTAISDLEVESRETQGKLWSFAYPLIDGQIDGLSEIVIATTRPETMLGDGAVAVHPSDERYKNLIGRKVRLPIAERLIPIIADEYPDPEFGTGAVKITGAHDFNDFEVARRNDIPLIPLMDGQAKMISSPDNNVPEHYGGLDRYDARKLVLNEIEELGFYRGAEEKMIAQPFGDRSGVVIEPMLTDQWYVDAKTLAAPAIESVRSGRTRFVPANWEKTYFDWMENIQPWCVSRQLWWGHRIPAWYGEDGAVFVEKSEDEARAAAAEHYGKKEGEIELRRDADVLDTWFSSALWPFSTLGWPEQTDALKTYYQTDVLVTGFDIIFFWVARMMMTGLHFMKDEKGKPLEPFHTVYVHALVRDAKGAKMSKSKGNVIDPLELMDKYGADALRFTLAIMAAQGRDVKLDESRIAGYRNFGTKLWNATRFMEMNDGERLNAFEPEQAENPVNRWILTELSKAVESVSVNIENFKFNEASSAAYRFVWNLFCDWYLELLKPIFSGADEKGKAESRTVAFYVLDGIYALLHPFMPFMTEELWAKSASGESGRGSGLLCHAPWPKADMRDLDAAAQVNWMIDAVNGIRSVRAEMNIKPGLRLPLFVMGESARRKLENFGELIKKTARLECADMVNEPVADAVQIVLDDAILFLPLKGIVDFADEKARLEKELAQLEADRKKLEARLGNEKFVQNAAAEIVAENRERLAEMEEKCRKIGESVSRLAQFE